MTEIDFKQLQLTIKKRMMRYRDHPDWDDGVQEAYIRAWEDMEAGIDDYTYLARRASMWGRAYLYNAHHYATGDLGRDRSGMKRKSGDLSREKIQNYVKEYQDLHGEHPTNIQISRALGMSDSNVSIHLKIIREQSFEFMSRESNDRAIDRGAYRYMSLSDLFTEEVMENPSPDEHKLLAVESFEDQLLSEEAFLALIEPLEEELKVALTLYHWYGWAQSDIGRYLGFDTNPQPRAKKRIDRAHKYLREALDNQGQLC